MSTNKTLDLLQQQARILLETADTLQIAYDTKAELVDMLRGKVSDLTQQLGLANTEIEELELAMEKDTNLALRLVKQAFELTYRGKPADKLSLWVEIANELGIEA